MFRFFIRSIKRLSYKMSKRLIRFFIYFHILVLLFTFSVSARSVYQYDSYQELAEGGGITTSVKYNNYWYPAYSIDNFDNFNDISIIRDDVFSGFRFTVYDAPLINLPFQRNDVVFINQTLAINIDNGTALTEKQIIAGFDFVVTTDLSNSVTDPNRNVFTISSQDIVEDVEITKYSTYDLIVIHLNGAVRLSPEVEGNITQISYAFNNISSKTVDVRIYPKKLNTDLIYYVGSYDGIPAYSSSDSSAVDDAHQQEQDILDEAFSNNPVQEFASSFGYIITYFNSSEFINSLQAWTYWFNSLVGYKYFRFIIYLAIILGLFAFTFSVARDGLSASHSVGRGSTKGTSIDKQRYKNFKGD